MNEEIGKELGDKQIELLAPPSQGRWDTEHLFDLTKKKVSREHIGQKVFAWGRVKGAPDFIRPEP